MKLFVEHTNDRGTETGFYFASLHEVEAWLSEQGLVAVPEEPSMEMIVAGNDAMGDCGSSFAYKAMVAKYREQAL